MKIENLERATVLKSWYEDALQRISFLNSSPSTETWDDGEGFISIERGLFLAKVRLDNIKKEIKNL
ncbi:MAG: hypothetical protein WC428_01655 [Candidatus Paceibacterota bacterium]